VPKVNYKQQKRQKEIAKKKKRDEKLKRKQEKSSNRFHPLIRNSKHKKNRGKSQER